MSQSKANLQTPIGRRSFLQGTGLTALGLPHLFAGGQSLLAATPGAEPQLPAVRAVAQAPHAAKVPTKPLVPWMYMIFPLEQWLSDYERTFDAWADGGVRGLVIGPLVFYKDVPRFDLTYTRPGVAIPHVPARAGDLSQVWGRTARRGTARCPQRETTARPRRKRGSPRMGDSVFRARAAWTRPVLCTGSVRSALPGRRN